MTDRWPEEFRARLLRLMEEQGLNPASLTKKAGLKERAIQSILDGRSQHPKANTMRAIAAALNVPVSLLFDESIMSKLFVIGAVSGEVWVPEHKTVGETEIRLEEGEPVAVQVADNSMAPAYRTGHMLIGNKRPGSEADKHIGTDCIVQTKTGERYVKWLAKGSRDGLYTLRSYDPAVPDIVDVELDWIAPIRLVDRG